MDATVTGDSVLTSECVKFDIKELKSALRLLHLTWAPVGDFMVVMHGEIDADICGEPYLARQMWLNLKTGKFISRLWNQTIATGMVATIEHFLLACKGFQGRPCIGCPLSPEEMSRNDHMILYTPIPRKISLSCVKFLRKKEDDIQTCQECQPLKDIPVKEEVREEEICSFEIKPEGLANETAGETDGNVDIPNDDKSLGMIEDDAEIEGTDSESEPSERQAPVRIAKKPGPKKRPFTGKCTWCDKKFSTEDTYYHHTRKTHYWRIFRCRKCGKREDFASDLIKHMTEEQHEGDGLFMCPVCQVKVSLPLFDVHYKECFDKKKKKQYNAKYICDICGNSIFKSYRKEHMKMHILNQSVKCQENNVDTDLFYYCDQCGARFTGKSGLTYHRKTQHEKVKYPCSECSEIFKTSVMRTNHIRIAHSTEEKYQCKHCKKRYGDVKQLKRHEIAHTGPQFQCRHCEKKLATENNLLRHERMHTGEKPFACKICSASFTSAPGLAQHKRGVHHIANRGGRTGWHRKGP